MPQLSIAKLFEDNHDKLNLSWSAKPNNEIYLNSDDINTSSKGLIGHLNFIHPNWIQVVGKSETDYLNKLDATASQRAIHEILNTGLKCILIAEHGDPPQALYEAAQIKHIPIIASSYPSLQLMSVLRYYLARELAETTTLHGVFLDVLGLGILITGESGVGKSELGLELISRGNGLVADDIVELYRIAPDTLEGRCPALLRDFLEVRGLGVLNMRTIFGETAVRPKKNLKLIVHLERPVGTHPAGLDRLPLNASSQEIMGVNVRKVVIPVAAGRNLAVLVEAAVRNYILQLRGIDSTQEFIRRHEHHLENH